MNDTQITVQGFVGATPTLKKAGETEVATFRLGCTPRYFNRRTNTWVDAPTQWYTVKAWRAMARNVAESLRKGDGVTVVGRLNVLPWTAQDGAERTTLEIEAISVGHDLRHGTTRFSRTEKSVERPELPSFASPAGPGSPSEVPVPLEAPAEVPVDVPEPVGEAASAVDWAGATSAA